MFTVLKAAKILVQQKLIGKEPRFQCLCCQLVQLSKFSLAFGTKLEGGGRCQHQVSSTAFLLLAEQLPLCIHLSDELRSSLGPSMS